MTKQKTILYFFDQNDWNSRMPVVTKASENGYKTGIVLIGSNPQTIAPPENITIDFIKTTQGRMNILALLQIVFSIFKLLQKHKPDLVHAITLKYAFMTGLAALSFTHLKKIYTLAGLGYLFRSEDRKAHLLQTLIAPFLKTTLKAPNARLIFQNPDDMCLMIEKGFADKEHSTLIRGSGVNLDIFKSSFIPRNETPVVLMPTRLVREKGVNVFVEAARSLKSRGVNARFQIAGGLTKHNPTAINEQEMQDYVSSGAIEWLGHVDDMSALLASADIVVYPPYYGEGIPRVLLEAAASGKPIITTDNPGCRETVNNGENGFLVPVKNSEAVANAIEILLSNPQMRIEMGHKSRKIAETEFDINLVTGQTLIVYDEPEYG